MIRDRRQDKNTAMNGTTTLNCYFYTFLLLTSTTFVSFIVLFLFLYFTVCEGKGQVGSGLLIVLLNPKPWGRGFCTCWVP